MSADDTDNFDDDEVETEEVSESTLNSIRADVDEKVVDTGEDHPKRIIKKVQVPWKPGYSVTKKKLKRMIVKEVIKLVKEGKKKDNEIWTRCAISETTFRRIISSAVEKGTLKKLETGHIERPNAVEIDYGNALDHKFDGVRFIDLPEIKKMSDSLRSSGKKDWVKQISRCLVVCWTINKSPRTIMDYKNTDGQKDSLKGLTAALEKFREHQTSGTVKYISKHVAKRWDGSDIPTAQEYVKAMRKLYATNGIAIPEGYAGPNHILSTRDENPGAYNDVAQTDKQYYEILDFIDQKYGRRYATAVGLMTEMVTRTDEFLTWINNLIIKKERFEDGNEYEYGIAKKFYTSKQKRDWSKVVIDPKVLAWSKDLPKGQIVFPRSEFPNIRKVAQTLAIAMREALVHIGMLPAEALLERNDPNFPRFKRGTNEYKMYKDPVNFCRHDGAARGLRRNNYNPARLVSRGWDSDRTLTKFYAKQPEYLMQGDVCFYCKPPPGYDGVEPESFNFCSEPHAIIFLNNGHKPKAKDNSLDKLIEQISKLTETVQKTNDEKAKLQEEIMALKSGQSQTITQPLIVTKEPEPQPEIIHVCSNCNRVGATYQDITYGSVFWWCNPECLDQYKKRGNIWVSPDMTQVQDLNRLNIHGPNNPNGPITSVEAIKQTSQFPMNTGLDIVNVSSPILCEHGKASTDECEECIKIKVESDTNLGSVLKEYGVKVSEPQKETGDITPVISTEPEPPEDIDDKKYEELGKIIEKSPIGNPTDPLAGVGDPEKQIASDPVPPPEPPTMPPTIVELGQGEPEITPNVVPFYESMSYEELSKYLDTWTPDVNNPEDLKTYNGITTRMARLIAENSA